MNNISHSSVSYISALLDCGEITSEYLCDYFLNRIKFFEDDINAFINVNENEIMSEARNSDIRRKNGKKLSKYDGIPISIKDIITQIHNPCTCGSSILSNYIAPYDATVVSRLKNKGIVIFGKNNMDEFGVGSTGKSSFYGCTYNPWDISRISGGSSSGSAASVASGETIASLGTDTGGSVRFPAALCGVVGFRPTYGTISRYGVVTHSSFLDQVGIIAKHVSDVSIIFDIINGEDRMDNTTISEKYLNYYFKSDINNFKNITDLNNIKVGIIKEYNDLDVDQNIINVQNKTIDMLKDLGANIVEVSIPHVKYAPSAYCVLSPVDITTNMARFDGIRYGRKASNFNDMNELYSNHRGTNFGHDVKKRILLGSYLLCNKYELYNRAKYVVKLLTQDIKHAFELCDVILTPIHSTMPTKISEQNDKKYEYLDDMFATLVNLSGTCGISLPIDIDKFNLPIGMQFICPFLNDKKLLSIMEILEKKIDNKNFSSYLKREY